MDPKNTNVDTPPFDHSRPKSYRARKNNNELQRRRCLFSNRLWSIFGSTSIRDQRREPIREFKAGDLILRGQKNERLFEFPVFLVAKKSCNIWPEVRVATFAGKGRRRKQGGKHPWPKSLTSQGITCNCLLEHTRFCDLARASEEDLVPIFSSAAPSGPGTWNGIKVGWKYGRQAVSDESYPSVMIWAEGRRADRKRRTSAAEGSPAQFGSSKWEREKKNKRWFGRAITVGPLPSPQARARSVSSTPEARYIRTQDSRFSGTTKGRIVSCWANSWTDYILAVEGLGAHGRFGRLWMPAGDDGETTGAFAQVRFFRSLSLLFFLPM